jgi:two-component system response regulator YesN
MLTILIVDDNPLDLNGVRDLIDWDGLGIQVVGVASDGEEGYSKAKELRPDIILTDVDMPVLDGLKMTEMIQKNVSNTKFVFMSCFDDFNYIKDAMDLDAFRYVLKPIKLEELSAVILKIKHVIELEVNKDRVQERLQQQLQVSLPVLQEQFFRDLLYGKWSVESEASEQLESLGIELVNKEYSVAFIEIDNYEAAYSNYSKEQKYAFIHQMIHCLTDILPQTRTRYISSHAYSCIVIVLSTNSDEGNDFMDLLNRCKDYLIEKMSCQVTIGISNNSDQLTRITELFYQAEYAVKSKFYGEGNCIIADSDTHSSKLDNNRHKKVVEDIKRFIEENFNTIENVEQIAATFYFSARYANHIFKQHTGKTIFDFLISTRVVAAKTMLLEPNAKVYDVSEKVGYLNNSYFCSLFKQNTGLTPKQYIDRYGRSS